MRILDPRVGTIFGKKLEDDVPAEGWIGGTKLVDGNNETSTVVVGELHEATVWRVPPEDDDALEIY